MQHHSKHPRAVRRAISMFVALTGLTLGCSETATSPPEVIVLRFSGTVPDFPGITLTHVRVTVSDEAGSPLADTTVALSGAPARMGGTGASMVAAASFEVAVEVTGTGPFPYETAILDGSGATVYRGAPGVAAGGGNQVIAVRTFNYVGVGAGAATLELQVNDSVVTVGAEITVTAILRDTSGTEVTGTPVTWGASSGALQIVGTATVGGRSQATFHAVTAADQELIVALTPDGTRGERPIEVRDIPVGFVRGRPAHRTKRCDHRELPGASGDPSGPGPGGERDDHVTAVTRRLHRLRDVPEREGNVCVVSDR